MNVRDFVLMILSALMSAAVWVRSHVLDGHATVAKTPAIPCHRAAVQFSSRYTDFVRDCVTMRGSHAGKSLVCDGPEGYSLHVLYGVDKSGELVQMAVAHGHWPENVFCYLGLDRMNFKARAVEWRLADGHPFAVIRTNDRYNVPYSGTSDYFPRPGWATSPDYVGERTKLDGQELVIRGLAGAEALDAVINASQEQAIEKARQLADTRFKQINNICP